MGDPKGYLLGGHPIHEEKGNERQCHFRSARHPTGHVHCDILQGLYVARISYYVPGVHITMKRNVRLRNRWAVDCAFPFLRAGPLA